MIRAIVVGATLTLSPLAGPMGAATDGLPPGTIEMGDVLFPHELHVDALGLPCGQCHHETDAEKLDIPHAGYFEDFWIQCQTCHRSKPATATVQTCSSCHRANPFDIADETLSAKVVVHRSCWECHSVGTGAEASASCATCHLNKRSAETG